MNDYANSQCSASITFNCSANAVLGSWLIVSGIDEHIRINSPDHDRIRFFSRVLPAQTIPLHPIIAHSSPVLVSLSQVLRQNLHYFRNMFTR